MSILLLTGAGISAESGLTTFRGQGGLWEGHALQDVATPQAWDKDPHLVWRFYTERRRSMMACDPNPAHLALARLESELEGHLCQEHEVERTRDRRPPEDEEILEQDMLEAEVIIVTQNVDDLHERAGSTHVIHLHGELGVLHQNGMPQRAWWTLEEEDLQEDKMPYVDDEGGIAHAAPKDLEFSRALRPSVVWFGEDVPLYGLAARLVDRADALWVIGTSAVVMPANLLPVLAMMRGIPRVWMNIDPPGMGEAHLYDEVIIGKAGETVPEYIESFLTHSSSSSDEPTLS